MKRITVTIPDAVYELLKNRVPNRQTSLFVTEAIKARAFYASGTSYSCCDEKINILHKKTKSYTTKKILKAVKKGRL
jgi:hypothetical protein